MEWESSSPNGSLYLTENHWAVSNEGIKLPWYPLFFHSSGNHSGTPSPFRSGALLRYTIPWKKERSERRQFETLSPLHLIRTCERRKFVFSVDQLWVEVDFLWQSVPIRFFPVVGWIGETARGIEWADRSDFKRETSRILSEEPSGSCRNR